MSGTAIAPLLARIFETCPSIGGIFYGAIATSDSLSVPAIAESTTAKSVQ
ncbi:hypothetical protein [Oxynema aestuarii]|uniref:Uncharacterized protein n=1 Tax=Oxynema aestuarii AP17 TaxID=2064643 RepID=A0A6H1U138_9CYAN|nr:hypothetical protein [Oxynema aestuarii]QIZ71880.1 hypothetical protein HCG48_15895 [Oxynema aestuarii AP17]